ncbi:MAG TPA: substrate-binding domain-containing protein [Aggregatilineales bacterium]|nr:substrate-binding domain-containing protein [Anaerolineales bacterium]HRE46545.1 substrate-binding domain-containing protein [Aggregatilineales bacterium]
MTDPLIGKHIAGYEVVSLIGHGGMADVYRAHQTAMKRDIALKVLSAQLANSPDFVDRFHREVEMAAGLEHAHIVPVYDHGRTPEGQIYLAMRIIRGGTLADRITQGAMPLDKVSTILKQLAGALDYAHGKGIVHRDIKPSNVLIDDQDDIYLADFGLAQLSEQPNQNNLTKTGALVGTPTYISPEQALTSKGDYRSDLYSLGVVLYEMVTGKPPFSGDSMFSVMKAHVGEPPPPASKFRPDLPASVNAVLLRALAKKPEDRYPNATELARDFGLAVQGLLVTQQRTLIMTSVSLTNLRSLNSVRTRNIAAIGLLTIVLLTLGLFLVSRLNPSATTGVAATVDEAQRPESGPPESVIPTAAEIETARAILKTSFIGVMACTTETEYHASLVRSMRLRAESYGFAVRVEDGKAEKSRQTTILNKFLADGAKVILMCPLDEGLIAPLVKAAQDGGVVVVSAGEKVWGKNAVSLTLTNETMGRKVGEYTVAMINEEMGGKANVVILEYPDVPTVTIRANAMEAALKAGAPDAVLLGRYIGGLSEEGKKSMTRILAEHPEVNVIMSINDNGALGAVSVLREAGKGFDEVRIVSVDAELEVRRLITAGEYFRATLDNDPVGAGVLAVDAAVRLLGGAVVPKLVLIEGRMMTKETLQVTPTAVATP